MAQIARWRKPIAGLATVFGAVTVLVGATALFGGTAAKQAAGDAVPIVLWFNFLAGFFYVAGGIAIWRNAPGAAAIAWVIGLGTLAVFVVLFALIITGTPYEGRTIGAMVLRSGFWIAIAVALTRERRKRS